MATTKQTKNTETPKTAYIAYYRVSTKKQGQSGLGLGAQKETVKNFIGNNALIAEYTEVESGKKDSRVELSKAIEHAKKASATLVIAKLDRLSRNVGFIFHLRDTKVDFVCCDIPEANTLTIGVFATMAQFEREQISKRTKDALAKAKTNGKTLGTPRNFTNEGRIKGATVRSISAKTNENNRRASSLAGTMKQSGASLRTIANQLNANGFQTSTDKAFQANTVKRLLDRI